MADENARFLAGELERLLSLPLNTKADLKAWYVQADKLQHVLGEKYCSLDFLHEIWHYLADADIRARDASYRRSQETIVRDYINDVRSS